MASAAQLIGTHFVAALFALALLLLVCTALLWHATQRYGDALWRAVAALWRLVARTPIAERARRIPFLRAGFSRTLSVWRYLGAHALLSFALAIASVSAFFELADEIHVSEELAMFDEQLAASLRTHVDGATLQWFAAITHLGDRNLLLAIGAAVAIYLLWKRWWLHAAVWLIATGLGGILVRVLKAVFERTRPVHDHVLTESAGWSFPSGHASGAVLVFGMLGYLIVRHTRSAWHIPVALCTMVLIVFVGFSRVILQVHYLSDVLAGFAAAGAWVALSIAAFETLRRRAERNAGTSSEVR